MSDDYHRYVIHNGEFVGRFEEMYEACEDPWPESVDDLNRNPVSTHTVTIIRRRQFKRVFSVGLGKGLHAAWIQSLVPGVEIEGCEISPTAEAHCRQQYPQIKSHCLSVEEFIHQTFDFDLLIMREILWYILPAWSEVATALARKYGGRHLVVELSFYDCQRYGLDYFDGPDELVRKFPFHIEEVVRHHVSAKQREGMISILARL